MNLDPRLGRIDRIGTVVIGAGLVAYAILGDFDRQWVRFAAGGLGAVFVFFWGVCGV